MYVCTCTCAYICYHSFFHRDMLKLGSSKPWPEVMEQMTGQRKMDVRPLIEYFKPLVDWLKEQNKMERTGWSEACPSFDDVETPPTKATDITSNAINITPMFSLTVTLISIFTFNIILVM